MTQPNQPTAAERQLAALAAALSDSNLDAAEALGKLLVAEAEQRKRVRGGCEIQIRWNAVTERVEMRSG